MRLLVIDQPAKDKIAKVIQYAESNKIPKYQMLIKSKSQEAIGDNPNYRLELEHGFRVVFSIEEQPIGWCKHLSISVSTPEKLPNVAACELICKQFDIDFKDKKNYVYLEEGMLKSVNIVSVL